ncbi:MAG: ABC transporter permease [Clostridiales Family XIII bacterium]|jgi:hypothetical protein|nr:ABC transporter permease [Clostridiales Family XIII bacterium]
MRGLIAAEWFKLTHNKTLPILLALAAVFVVAQAEGSAFKNDVILGQFGVTLLSALSAFEVMLLVAFVGFFVTTEFDNGAVRNSLALGKNRLCLYLSKQVSVCVAIAALLLASSLVATAVGTVRSGFGEMSAAAYAGFFLTIFGLHLLYHTVYAAFFTMIAFVTRNSILTVLLCVGVIVIEIMLVSLLGFSGEFGQTARTVFPVYSIKLLYSTGDPAFFGYADPAFLARSVIASAAEIALLIGIGAWAFKKAEIK